MLPFHVVQAAESGRLDIVRSWLQEEPTAEIDAGYGPTGWNLLHRCCLNSPIRVENVAFAEFLLSRGADVNHRASGGACATPLFLAASRHYNSQADMVGLLLRAGADVNIRERRFLETPLAWALKSFTSVLDERALECVVKLLRAGASLDSIGRFADAGESKSLEDHMARRMSWQEDLATYEHFVALQGIVTDLRAAGSWRQYVLAPPKAMLRLRSLVARGRAREVRRLRARTPRPLAWIMSPDVPKEIVWRVLEYWNPRE